MCTVYTIHEFNFILLILHLSVVKLLSNENCSFRWINGDKINFTSFQKTALNSEVSLVYHSEHQHQ